MASELVKWVTWQSATLLKGGKGTSKLRIVSQGDLCYGNKK